VGVIVAAPVRQQARRTERAGVRSALPAYHGVDLDRGERIGAALGNGIVPIDPQLLANSDGPLVEPVRTLRDTLGGEVPPGAGRPASSAVIQSWRRASLSGCCRTTLLLSQSATRTKETDRTIRSTSLDESVFGLIRRVAKSWASTFPVSQRDMASSWLERIFFASARMSPCLTPN
jgi:hypothetical protein